jgi:hypothetical protein
MNFREWLLTEGKIIYKPRNPAHRGWPAPGRIALLSAEQKQKLGEHIMEAMSGKPFSGNALIALIRHEFTTYDQEMNLYTFQPPGCEKLKNRAIRTRETHEYVQDVINHLVPESWINDATTANDQWLQAKMQEWRDEETKLVSRGLIPNDYDRKIAKNAGVNTKNKRTCSDLWPTMYAT